MGAVIAGWAGYQLDRFRRTGEISAVSDILLEATENDPPLWLWLIVLMNSVFLALGLVMIVEGLS